MHASPAALGSGEERETADPELEELEISILEQLTQLPANHGISARSLDEILQVGEQRITYHLKRLKDGEYLGDFLTRGRPTK